MQLTNAPTIREVAQRAGVSISTVSRTLTGSKAVAKTTQQRVRRAIKDLGYYPSLMTRGLTLGGAAIVVVMVPDYSPFFTELTCGVEEGLPHGSSALMVSTHGRIASEEQQLAVIRQFNPIGLVIAPCASPPRTLQNAGFPVVFVHRFPDHALKHFDVVESDNWTGGQLAARYIAQRGHRRMVIVAGPSGYRTSDQKVEGFLKELERWNLSADICRGDITWDFGLAVGNVLATQDYSCAFCVTDEMALAVMQAFHQRGKTVPGDFSVMGFDDDWPSHLFPINLTTIRQSPRAMGRMAAELIFRRLESPTVGPVRKRLPVELVPRESVAQLRGVQTPTELATAVSQK